MRYLPFGLCLIALCAFGGDAPEASLPIGRYQLVTGEVHVGSEDSHGSPHAVIVKMIWKIDTATGRTWHYNVNLDKAVLRERWVETTEKESLYESK